MGTSESLPVWTADLLVMERYGWTERQLREEVSLKTMGQIRVLEELRAKADKVKR